MLCAIAICLVEVENIFEAESRLNKKNTVINSMAWHRPTRGIVWYRPQVSHICHLEIMYLQFHKTYL